MTPDYTQAIKQCELGYSDVACTRKSERRRRRMVERRWARQLAARCAFYRFLGDRDDDDLATSARSPERASERASGSGDYDDDDDEQTDGHALVRVLYAHGAR